MWSKNYNGWAVQRGSALADSDSIFLLILAPPTRALLIKQKIGKPTDPDSWHVLFVDARNISVSTPESYQLQELLLSCHSSFPSLEISHLQTPISHEGSWPNTHSGKFIVSLETCQKFSGTQNLQNMLKKMTNIVINFWSKKFCI